MSKIKLDRLTHWCKFSENKLPDLDTGHTDMVCHVNFSFWGFDTTQPH